MARRAKEREGTRTHRLDVEIRDLARGPDVGEAEVDLAGQDRLAGAAPVRDPEVEREVRTVAAHRRAAASRPLMSAG